MRFHTILFVVLIFLIPSFCLPSNAQVPSSPEIPKAVKVEEVHQFIDEYAKRFMKMDLDAYMALLSKDAVENRMLPYADIREAYRRTIEASKSLIYDVKINSIQTYTKSAFVSGRYKIIQILKAKNKERVFQGNIQWELVREDDSLKIKEINYGRDR